MKVIMLKKWDKYNVDEIVEVSNGFGTNFLIKNGYAAPINKSTQHALETKKENEKKDYDAKRKQALEIKEKLEKEKLTFYLKTTNLVVHGSISTKKINQALIERGYKIDRHSFEHLAINSLGITKTKIKLFDDVVATLEIEVKGEK